MLAVLTSRRSRSGIAQVAGDYLSLLKPRILLLLLATELGGMIIAARGWPGLTLTAAALIGGALCAGGSGAVNCWFDRDIDARMARTRGRPLPAGRIRPDLGLAFGLTVGALGIAVTTFLVNPVAGALSLVGGLVYVIVYTMWLKRSTPQNIVIGGAAGAFPPLVGWAAVTHGIAPLGIALFAIVFFWTPPHFWALALLLRRQYSDVQVPMLPVVAGEAATRRSILGYTLVLAAVSLLPGPWLGPLYLGPAAVLSALFVWLAWRALRDARGVRARQLFQYSLAYLALIFAVAAMAAVLPPGRIL
jgi:heme o synthase